MDDSASRLIGSLAYLFGFIGALVLRRNRRPEVRYHAAQSLSIDIVALLLIVLVSIPAGIYSAMRYDGEPLPENDPLITGASVVGAVLVLLLEIPLRMVCAVQTARGRPLVIPVLSRYGTRRADRVSSRMYLPRQSGLLGRLRAVQVNGNAGAGGSSGVEDTFSHGVFEHSGEVDVSQDLRTSPNEAWLESSLGSGAEPSSAAQVDAAVDSHAYDVALSFAGENRAYVEEVASRLRAAGVKVFYDEFERPQMWGEDLYVFLDSIYRQRSRFVVLFISVHYVRKPWPTHERQSAQARALEAMGRAYVLPVRLDDSELPGLRPTTGHVDARDMPAVRLAELIIAKIGGAPGRATAVAPMRVPRTAAEVAALLSLRPEGWEYLYYGAVLLSEARKLDPKWRDHEMGFARRTGHSVLRHEALYYAGERAGELAAILGRVEQVTARHIQERAFGPSGKPGEPALIEHMARRLVDIFSDVLDWAAEVRAVIVDSDVATLYRYLSQFADLPLRQFQEFIARAVRDLDAIPERLEEGSPIYLVLKLKITADDRLIFKYKRKAKRLRRRLH